MPEKVKKAESKVLEQIKERWNAAADDSVEWYDRAREAYEFYLGIGQWDEEVIRTLDTEGRPHFTINLIFPIVNLLAGYQRQNRTDIKLFPRHGGTISIANLGTELMKHTMDMSDGDYETSDCFLDGLISAKGWLTIDRVFMDDPLRGDLVVHKESPFDILEDQNNRSYDVNKGDYIFKTFWWNKKELELAFPGKTKNLDEAFETQDWGLDRYYEHVDTGDYPTDPTIVGDRQDERYKTHYRVREQYYKQWENCVILFELATGRKRRLIGDEIEKAKRLVTKANREYKIIERSQPVLYKTTSVGELLLEHIRDPFDGLTLFPFFRFAPYWVDGYVMGVVDNLKESQQEVNKRRSQALHHLNTTANSGWVVGSDRNKQAIQNLEKFGSKPGVILSKADFDNYLERITPNPLDVGHFALADQAAKDMQNISGINPSLLEQVPEGKESGRAKMLRQQAGLVVSEIIFDNFARTQKQLGIFLWEIIRRTDVYSEQEIMSIVQESNLKSFIKQGPEGQQIIDISPIRSWYLGRYGIKVSRSTNLPTVKMANFEMALDALRAGLPIPPDIIMELSDLPNKDEIVARLKQMPAQLPSKA